MMTRWQAAAYTSLTVSLYVTAPATVELVTQERIRVDRAADTGVERYTDVLPAGANLLDLMPGLYLFRAARDVELNLNGSRSVHVTAHDSKGKDGWPEVQKGDSTPDHAPDLAVNR